MSGECHLHNHEEKATYLFSISNIDCQNCANKLEEAFKKIEGIENVKLSFINETLTYECEHDEGKRIKEEIQMIIDRLEPDAVLTSKGHKHHHESDHHEHCDCDHHHHHEKEIIETALTRKYRIEGLDCESCAIKLEEKLSEIEGISNVNVSYVRGSLSFDASEEELERIKKDVKRITKEEEEEAEIIFDNIKNKEYDLDKIILVRLVVGSLLFFIGLLFAGNTRLVIHLLSYLVLGYDVLLKAIRNIGKGNIFDEHFLMAIATIAAIYLKEYSEAAGVMLFYQVGEYLQDLAVKRSRKSISDLMDIKPESANVIREGQKIVLDPNLVKIGDILEVNPGEKIPLDGIVINGASSINTAFLTGESAYKDIDVGDEVLSGSINESGLIQLEVVREYGDSAVNKILSLIEDSENNKASHERFITKFSKYYTPIVVFAAIITAIVIGVLYKDINEGIYRACTFLVISCPCALVISIPLSFFAGIGGLSKKGILVKGADVIEKMTDIKQVIMDKTGTITEGEFEVIEVRDSDDKDEVLRLAALAESHSKHPIAKAICKAAIINEESIESIQEIAGRGIEAIIDNEEVLVGNYKLMKDNDIKVNEYNNGTIVYVAKDKNYLGTIILKDKLKEKATKAIKSIKGLGLRTIIVSGDNKEIVEEIKNEAKVDEAYGECLPGDKVNLLEKINQKGSCAFVGDGINDAPVLVAADVGFAMGALGSDAAVEAADIVLMDDDLDKIPMAYRNSNRIIRVAKENIYCAILIKALILVLGALGLANMWMAIFADTGVAMLCILNSMRLLKAR